MAKIQIRAGVFETNSSSVHTITICSKDTYDKWSRGEVFYCDCTGEWVTKEELPEKIKEWEKDRPGMKYPEPGTPERQEYLDDPYYDYDLFYTQDEWYGYCTRDLEPYDTDQTITDPETGKEIDVVAFGYHGRNG